MATLRELLIPLPSLSAAVAYPVPVVEGVKTVACGRAGIVHHNHLHNLHDRHIRQKCQAFPSDEERVRITA